MFPSPEIDNLQEKLITIQKAPLYKWEYSTVAIWISSLKLREESNVQSIVKERQISGAQLKQAYMSKSAMMNLFNGHSPIFPSGFSFGTLTITLSTAASLCQAVKDILYKINNRLIENKNKFDAANKGNKLSQHMIQNQCETPPQAQPAPKWKTKPIKKWHCNDVQKWVKSLNIDNDKKKTILNAWYKGNRDGKYLDKITCGMEIANDDHLVTCSIIPPLGKLIYEEIKIVKKEQKKNPKKRKKAENLDLDNDFMIIEEPNYAFPDNSNTQSQQNDKPNNIYKKKRNYVNWKDEEVENWSVEDLKDWIKTLDIADADMMKIIYNINTGQCTGHDFQEIGSGKEIAESFDMLESLHLCNFIYDSLQSRISDKVGVVNTHEQIYGNGITDDVDMNDSKINNQNAGMVPNNGWRNKDINDWTCQELQGWIFSLTHLTIGVQLELMEEVRNADMGGEYFNSCTNANDIIESFDTITQSIGYKVYKSLERVRTNRDREKVRKNRDREKIENVTSIQAKNKEHLTNASSKETILKKYNKAMRDNSCLKQDIRQKEKKCIQLRTMISKLQHHNTTHESNYKGLQEENRKLKQTNNEISAASGSLQQLNTDQTRKYNVLLEKYNQAIKDNSSLKQNIGQQEKFVSQHNNQLRTEMSHLKQENSSVIAWNTELTQTNSNLNDQCKKLTKHNSDLNEECKELKMELKDIKNKYNKWVTQNSDYTTWDCDTIIDWIIGLDKQFIRYENILRKQLKEEEITGADLIYWDKNDLNRFGIKVFKHKQRIIDEIEKLTARQQNNYIQNENNNIIAYNEGKKETQYIEK